MKSFVTFLTAALALAAVPAFAQGQAPKAPASAPAQAQQIDPPVIAVVDVNEVVSRSKAGRALQPQFEKLKKSYEDELSKNRDALTAEAKQLDGQRNVLAPEAFQQKVNALRQKEQTLATQINERKRVLDATLGNGLAEIRNVLFQVSADIARERGINIVLPKETVVIIARNLEITDEVLRRVDEKMPSYTLKVAQPGQGGQPAAQRPQRQQQKK
jgi:Skp family chaperone for outer membrane proteins